MNIETPNLILINCDLELVKIILSGNDELAKYLNIKVPENWNEFGEPAFTFSLQRLSENPLEQPWLVYLAILKNENILIGDGGYKGKPDDAGMVEIGYEICSTYRNRGFATEFTSALTNLAFKSKDVKIVQAHTVVGNVASIKVLKKAGFVFVEELWDAEDGMLWKWEIVKNSN